MTPTQRKLNEHETVFLFLDLDQVLLRRSREREEGVDTHGDYAILMTILAILKEKCNIQIVFVTDRGAEQLPPLDYMISGARFHAGESGAVAYDSIRHTIIVNPLFEEHIQFIQKYLLTELQRKFGNINYAFEPGVSSSFRLELYDPENQTYVKEIHKYLAETAEKFPTFLCEHHGDVISFKPKINKQIALEFIRDLDKEYLNVEINWKNSFCIGDSRNDIPMADFIIYHGGIGASVGNGAQEYKEFIRKHHGFVAEQNNTKGVIQILLHFFPSILTKEILEETWNSTQKKIHSFFLK